MPLSIRTGAAWRRSLALFVGGLRAPVLFAAVPPRRAFDLPAGKAEPALTRLSQQAGVQLVFDTRLVEDVTVNAVRGEFTPLEAAQRLLAGTVLRARRDEASGILSAEREPEPPREKKIRRALILRRPRAPRPRPAVFHPDQPNQPNPNP